HDFCNEKRDFRFSKPLARARVRPVSEGIPRVIFYTRGESMGIKAVWIIEKKRISACKSGRAEHFFIFADFFFEKHLARLVFDNAVERTDGNAAHNVAGTEKTKRFTHYLVNDERLVCKSEKVLFRGHELL